MPSLGDWSITHIIGMEWLASSYTHGVVNQEAGSYTCFLYPTMLVVVGQWIGHLGVGVDFHYLNNFSCQPISISSSEKSKDKP